MGASFSRIRPALVVQLDAGVGGETDGTDPDKARLTKQLLVLKLQGKYLGTMRGLPATKRARVKRIRAEKGIRAAIAAAVRMAS